MAKHIKLGIAGEEAAQAYLKQKGYQILETNWRYSRAEVDIIAKDGEILVFVEVKTRSSTFYGQTPEVFVTPKKEAFLKDAAGVYMEKINHDWEIRFDIIAIIKNDRELKIQHLIDAFWD